MATPQDLNWMLRAVAKRDRRAFSGLYDAQSAKLYAVILRICRDRALAEDVLQEVFVAVWRKAASYDGAKGAPGAWLCAIARNRALDAVRSRARIEDPTEAEEIERMAGAIDLEAARGTFADLDALAHCLDRLDGTQKQAVLLAYYEGRSREDLSQRFETPVNTIKTWLRRGLAKLRLCMEE